MQNLQKPCVVTKPVTALFGRLRQGDSEFETSLGYRVSSRLPLLHNETLSWEKKKMKKLQDERENSKTEGTIKEKRLLATRSFSVEYTQEKYTFSCPDI